MAAVGGDGDSARSPAAVVDIGSTTVRLEVAHAGRPVYRQRAWLWLGDAVEAFGAIPDPKLDEVASCVAGYVGRAREHGVDRVEVLVTSPGRQAANAVELLERVERAAGVPVRLLTAAEEARLAFAGALTELPELPPTSRVAVVDVGGGSAQIAVGTRGEGVDWVRSLDVGSTRLTRRCFRCDPPGRVALARARAEVDGLLVGVVPPPVEAVLAVGGSARALKRVTGSSRLDREGLAEAALLLAQTPAAEIAERHALPPGRAGALTAGAVILQAIAERLGVGLRVVRGGIREGALLEAGEARAAA
jgi:exopolyphosphatase/guanosine-5'-triphosphate,3'-diphosphate pyrophosphatase